MGVLYDKWRNTLKSYVGDRRPGVSCAYTQLHVVMKRNLAEERVTVKAAKRHVGIPSIPAETLLDCPDPQWLTVIRFQGASYLSYDPDYVRSELKRV